MVRGVGSAEFLQCVQEAYELSFVQVWPSGSWFPTLPMPAFDAHYLDACRSITMADMAQKRAEMDAAYLELRRHELLHRSK